MPVRHNIERWIESRLGLMHGKMHVAVNSTINSLHAFRLHKSLDCYINMSKLKDYTYSSRIPQKVPCSSTCVPLIIIQNNWNLFTRLALAGLNK